MEEQSDTPNKRQRLSTSPSPVVKQEKSSQLHRLFELDDDESDQHQAASKEVQASASGEPELMEVDEEAEEDQCAICLQPIVDRTIVPGCAHEFCFECLLIWTGKHLAFSIREHVPLQSVPEQSRRCPLCSQALGTYLIHRVRSKFDYQKHFLPPLPSASPRPNVTQPYSIAGRDTRRAQRVRREWGRARRTDAEREADSLERAIAKRRWVYENGLYAKVHIFLESKYRGHPNPQ